MGIVAIAWIAYYDPTSHACFGRGAAWKKYFVDDCRRAKRLEGVEIAGGVALVGVA